MTSDGIHSYSYDAEGNLLTVDNGGTATYVYDALNRRVGVKTAGSAHEYSFDYAGRRVSSWLLNQAGYPQGLGDEGRIYWDGQQIAYRALDGSTYFDHQDYLGTERLRTNHAGAAVATFATLPWGDGGTTTFGGSGADQDNSSFAGLDFDQESGSDHAQFRNYSTAQGRWLSPDPYDGSYDFTNPQSFNRYAYVLNNPLSFVDPTGLYCAVGIKGCKQGVGGSGDGDLSIVDSVDAGAGTYSYSGDVWDNTMQEGLGGGVTEDNDGSLWSSDGTGDQFLGFTWQSMILTGSIQFSTMANGSVFIEAPSNGQKPKSPARQMCEANARATLQSSLGSAANETAVGSLEGGAGTLLYNAGKGCLVGAGVTAIVGFELGPFDAVPAAGACLEGAADGVVSGAAGLVINSVIAGGLSGGVSTAGALFTYVQGMNACKSL